MRRCSAPGDAEPARHEALLYDGEEQFLAGTLPFIQDALAAGDPIVVAVDEAKIELLEVRARGDAKYVQFADMREIGGNPARLIPGVASTSSTRACGPGRRVWGIGEPIWAGRSDAELVECQRHESLLNLAFADAGPLSFLCPYDTGALDAEVIAEAHRSHAALVQGGTRRRSHSFCAHEAAAPFAERLPEPRGPVGECAFAAGDLAGVRRFVARRAQAAGLAASRCDDLVLAVNEVASNSVRHGGGRGTLRIWQQRRRPDLRGARRRAAGRPARGPAAARHRGDRRPRPLDREPGVRPRAGALVPRGQRRAHPHAHALTARRSLRFSSRAGIRG